MIERVHETPIGPLVLAADGGALVALRFIDIADDGARELAPAREAGPARDELGSRDASVLTEACRELDAYFARRLRAFSVPLAPSGTIFQLSVWDALRAIPFGETRSYADIALMTGRPRAFRAVGMANHANPLPIFIPCHRVINANGSLGGYGGGLEAKRALLEIEGLEITRG